jgi:hypothetical protein
MSWTKRQIIMQAFEEIGFANFVYDIPPEQLNSALRRMDLVVEGWSAKGIKFPYPTHINPEDSSLDEDSNLPARAIMTLYSRLAILIAPSFGKTVQQETRENYKNGMTDLIASCAEYIERQLDNSIPCGAGNKAQGQLYPNTITDSVDSGNEGILDI